MTARAGNHGRLSRWSLTAQAQHRAVESCRVDAARLSDDIGLAVSALSAISDRARDMSGTSARVRALGLECLPNGGYLAACVRSLRFTLNNTRRQRRRLAAARARADEVHAMLQTAIEFTATIDIPGELGLPLDLVSNVQTSARAGLASLSRLRDALDTVESEHAASPSARTSDAQPSRPAQWLVHTASQLLPSGSRERYFEEFTSELRELADSDAGSTAQIVHALRLASRMWALRNALLATSPPPATSPDRVRTLLRVDGVTPVPPQSGFWDPLRKAIARWNAHHEARVVIRRQARAQKKQDHASRYDHTAHFRRIDVEVRHHRNRLPLRLLYRRFTRPRSVDSNSSGRVRIRGSDSRTDEPT